MERRLRAQLWLRASVTKHFENAAQTCLCAAKFWSALMQLQMPLLSEAIGTREMLPRAKIPRLQC